MEAEQENNGDQNLLRNDLGDNRGTKIKREIPQLLIFNELRDSTVPRTGLEPARLSTLAPETSASTIPPPGLSELRCKGSAFRADVQIFRDIFLRFLPDGWGSEQ